MQNSLWHYVILTQLAHTIPRNFLKHTYEKPIKHSKIFKYEHNSEKFTEADHWPDCFSPQVFHFIIFYWISVFDIPCKMKNSFFLHILNLFCPNPLRFQYATAHGTFFPIISHTSCKSEMWDDMERILNVHISNSFLLNGDSRKQTLNSETFLCTEPLKELRQYNWSNAEQTCSLR